MTVRAVERRPFGRTGISVSVLGFGGSEVGYERVSARTVDRLLAEALDAGLNVVDTAECYEGSEGLIGHALRGRRDQCYVFTKCGHPHGGYRGNWQADSLLWSIERSLKRLRTDHVDLVQLHSCALAALQRGECITALERARQRGMTRWIGYSGDGEAARWAVESGRFDTLQTSVSIADQEALELTLPLASARRMGVIAKRPLANVAWRYARKPAEPYYQPYWSRLRTLAYDFLKADADGAVSSALRFTLAAPGVHTAIVGTTKPGRWQANAALLDKGPLSAAEVERIRARWRAVADVTWTGEI